VKRNILGEQRDYVAAVLSMASKSSQGLASYLPMVPWNGAQVAEIAGWIQKLLWPPDELSACCKCRQFPCQCFDGTAQFKMLANSALHAQQHDRRWHQPIQALSM
jgi:hypothetical protein